jgi:hypothetical protein
MRRQKFTCDGRQSHRELAAAQGVAPDKLVGIHGHGSSPTRPKPPILRWIELPGAVVAPKVRAELVKRKVRLEGASARQTLESGPVRFSILHSRGSRR